MKCLNTIEAMLMNEMQEIADRGSLDSGYLETIFKLSASIKNIKKIKWMMEQNEEEDTGREEMLAEIESLMSTFKTKYGDIK